MPFFQALRSLRSVPAGPPPRKKMLSPGQMARRMMKSGLTTASTSKTSFRRAFFGARNSPQPKGSSDARHVGLDEASAGHAGKNAGNASRAGTDRGGRAGGRRHGSRDPHRQAPDEKSCDRRSAPQSRRESHS